MKTGEGKTLVSTLAAYLNALTGNGVHGMPSFHRWHWDIIWFRGRKAPLYTVTESRCCISVYQTLFLMFWGIRISYYNVEFFKLHVEGHAISPTNGSWTSLLPTLLMWALIILSSSVVTVNDYLAQRDAEWMGRVHRFLGLSVGLIQVFLFH